ncbi:type II secretion system GspH family protein [Candidatus Microgenomates bacterium]|nr:type II secretion system GspH family protein [Candidatus Microgenomates bacterium]
MNKAYTLIEILVTITIIGLVFLAGYAGFQDFNRRQAIASVSRLIRSDLKLAQEQALAGKKPELDEDQNSVSCQGSLQYYGFEVLSDTSYKVSAYCPNEIILKTINLDSNLILTDPVPNPIKFKPIGQGTNITESTSSYVVVTMAQNNYSQTITIGSNGDIN